MPELVVEIGVEELPASFLEQALASFGEAAEKLLREARLGDEVTMLGTPRRIALHAEVAAAQPDRSDVVMGPPWSVAFKDGEPTKAALGFAKKNGVEVSALEKATTDKGEYVSAKVFEAGRPAAAVLSELLPAACAKIRFPKQMRWGAGEHAFGRPIHWLLALLDADVVPFTLTEVQSDRRSRGHRFLAPAVFEVARAQDYVARLAEARVVVTPSERRERMVSALDAAAVELGGEVVPDEFLVGECMHLVEEPFVVPGSFDEVFLELPAEVVISVMRDHQRYFAVRGPEGLLPRYLNVVNTAEDPARISQGNDRVLRARLADARFFVAEDRKAKLETRRAKLDTVVFQRKLGTVGQKVDRVTTLARAFAEGAGVDADAAARAAALCKCDLETLIVFEFPELQGQMGRFYATHDGEPADIAQAIEEHYQPKGASDAVAPSPLGALLAIADRVDTLVGCFAIGKAPKGNADPFGLRRASLGVLRSALEGPIDVPVDAWLDASAAAYAEQGVVLDEASRAQLDEFVDTRVRGILRSDFPADIVQAALGAWRESTDGSIRDLQARAGALATLRAGDDYDALAIAFKRAFNIAGASQERGWEEGRVQDGSERALVDAFVAARARIDTATDEGDYAGALAVVASALRAPIDTYFDDVLVIDENDAEGTKHRLALLAEIAGCVSRIAHFHLLEGSKES